MDGVLQNLLVILQTKCVKGNLYKPSCINTAAPIDQLAKKKSHQPVLSSWFHLPLGSAYLAENLSMSLIH